MQHKLNLIITDEAYSDIDRIASYIVLDNPKAAGDIVQMLFKACDNLTRFPQMGSHPNYIKNEQVRIFIVKGMFIIAYRIDNDKLVVFKISNRYQNIYHLLQQKDVKKDL